MRVARGDSCVYQTVCTLNIGVPCLALRRDIVTTSRRAVFARGLRSAPLRSAPPPSVERGHASGGARCARQSAKRKERKITNGEKKRTAKRRPI